MTMPRHPLLRLFVVAAIVELVVGTTTWHPPLRDTVTAARQFWERDDVQRAPLEAWRSLCDSAARMLEKPDGVVGALVNLLLGLVLVVVGVPLMIVGAVVIGVLWLLPYLAVEFVLWLAWVLITLRVLPVAPVALWLHYRRQRLAVFGQTGCATTPAVPAPAARPTAVRPAVTVQATLATMGPEQGALAGRIDPYTRTAFVTGERFVRCEGRCGRAYKLASWAQFGERCPVDGAALALGQAGAASTVTQAETHHSSPA
jgi:hypothetical protein